MSKPPLGARKDEKWYAMGIEPSITKTPIGPIQVPVPYQVISDLSQSTATSDSVFLNGQPAYLLDQSKMPKCMGDEQGTSGGTRSSTTSMEVKPVSGSQSVKLNRKNAIRKGDPCTLNKENCKGKFITSAEPVEGSSVSSKVRIVIRSLQNTICPKEPIELEAIVTPSGTPFTWSVSDPFEIIDSLGNPVMPGSRRVKVRLKKQGENHPDSASITVMTSNGKAKSVVSIPVHKGPVFGIKWNTRPARREELVFGTITNNLSANYSIAAGNDDTIKTDSFLSTQSERDDKLQLVANIKRIVPDVIEAIKTKDEEMIRTASTLVRRLVMAEEAFQTQIKSFVTEILISTSEKAIEFERKAIQYGRMMEQKATQFQDVYNALQLIKRIYYGRIAYYFDGDSSGFMKRPLTPSQAKPVHEPPYEFRYQNENYAVVAIPGMYWDYDQTVAMQTTCQYTFGIKHSTRIRNYTNRYVYVAGDFIQSALSEAVGAIDPHSIAAAVGISEGIWQKGSVYVVAHSQGSEISKSAFEFIQEMEKLPLYLRRMVVETTIFNPVVESILSNMIDPRAQLLGVLAENLAEQAKIKPELIVSVGNLSKINRNNIHYQGFGSETYIHKDLYDLGSARTARTHGDPIPDYGRMAKRILAEIMMSNDLTREAGIAKLHRVEEEQWEYVESPVKRNALLECLCLDIPRHDWFKNYWVHVMIPSRSKGIPDHEAVLTAPQLKQFKAQKQNESSPSSSEGFSIMRRAA